MPTQEAFNEMDLQAAMPSQRSPSDHAPLASPSEAQSSAMQQQTRLRVLHGLTGAAGQPWTISRAQRRLGLTADCISIDQSKYAYGADRHLSIKADEFAELSRYLVDACRHYDVFHFYFRPFFLFETRRLLFPTGLDLLSLRAAGKTIIFHYRGSEVRTASKFRELSPFHYVDENPHSLFNKFPEETVEAFTNFVLGVAHEVLVPDPELQSYVPGSSIVPRAVDLRKWEYVGVPDEDEPLIVHAPSRRVVKGTDAILRAVADLEQEGLRFRFRLVENLTNDEAREVYRQASIVVDQLRIGWYGVLAVEAMSLGKATVSFIRDDLLHHLEPDMPLACANPLTIKDVLRTLIQDQSLRKQLGTRGRKYCEDNHDADRIANDLIALYGRARENPKPASIEACLDFLMIQRRHTHGRYKKLLMRSYGVRKGIWKYLFLIEQQGFRRATAQAMGKAFSMISEATPGVRSKSQ